MIIGRGRGGVQGGVVRGDPAGSAGGGSVDPGAGGEASCASPDGAAGVGVGDRRRRGRRRCGRRGCWSRSSRRSMRCCESIWTRRASSGIPPGGCWPGWSMSTTPGICRTRRCGTTSPTAAGDLGGGGPVGRAGVRPAGPRDRRRGRGRLRRSVGDPARGEDQDAPVHVPAVGLGQGGASGVRSPRGRRRSWRATCTRSTGWAGCRSRHVRYDNLKAAVSRVLSGRNRLESDRWVAFRSHYGFDAFYCQPGVDGAHEKGGVEGEGGRFRRTHCVPMPRGRLDRASSTSCSPPRTPRTTTAGSGTGAQTVGHDGQLERASLRPLPAEPFPTWLTLDPAGGPVCPGHGPAMSVLGAGAADRPDRSGSSSAPPRCGSSTAERRSPAMSGCVARGGQSLILDHYLEVLQRKPGALPGRDRAGPGPRRGRVHRRCTTRSGRRPGPGSATPPAPGP